MANHIDFTDYDRVVDNIFYFTQNISMSFTVVMSRKNQSNNHRMFFQYETEYSSKYSDTNIGRSIKRNINYYYTIDNKNDFANGFILRPQDVELMCMVIGNQIMPWLIGNKRIFGITKDKSRLIIKGEFSPVIYAQSEYKYLKFVPIVVTFEDGTYKEGIRMYLNSDSEFADMDLDKFLGLYHILRTTDMYAVACSMLNYAKMPPYGVNTFRMSGLGGGYVNNDWDNSDDISELKNNKGKGNSFLDNAKAKKEE